MPPTTPITDPFKYNTVLHGSSKDSLMLIMKYGVKKMNRDYISFSSKPP